MTKTILSTTSALPNLIVRNVLFAILCLPLARLGVSFAFEGSAISLVWPLSGVTLAALLLFGRDLWAGVWLGYFLHNILTGTPLVTSFGIATGSAAAVYLSVYSLQKTVDFHPTLDRTRDVLNFICFGAALAPIIAALVGVSSLFLSGLVQPQAFAFDVFTWWSGDAMGILVLTPVLLIWNKVAFKLPSRRRWVEALVLSGAMIIICWVVFSQGFGPRSFYSLSYLIFPFLVWGALRFDVRMVVTLTLIVALIAVFQTGQQFTSFSRQMLWNSVLFLWAYIATMAITAMLLAATFTERRLAQRIVGSAEAALRESEAHYRQLFQGIDDAIFVHDLDANILDVNEATCRRLGYSRDDLLHMKITDLDTPEFAAGFVERLQQQLAFGFLSEIEGVRVAKDGRQIDVNVTTKVITYAGKPAILAVDRDITERKLSEQQLRESEARYRAIVEDQTELICRLAPDSQVRFVNDAYCRYFGMTSDELVGSYFRPKIHDADQPMITEVFRSLSTEKPVVNVEFRMYRPDGKLRWHQITNRAIFDASGHIFEFQLVGKDITELKEMEEQRVAVAVEHEKVQILTDFIAAASHDFRTPLSVINTSAYLLNRVKEDEQRERHYKKIQEQTIHIEKLVEGLLTMSRLDQGDVFRFRPAIQLNAVMQQIDARKRQQVEEKSVKLTLELDPNLPTIEADETWIFRAIVQLLDNAIHYTPAGGEITLRTENVLPNRIQISIRDTGVGISGEDMPHIFKRLYRGEGHRPVGGQGLGLSIAAKIIEAHRGRIEVDSIPEQGSTFRVILPTKRSDTSAISSPAP